MCEYGIKTFPQNTLLWQYRGTALLELNDWDGAIESFLTGIEKHPQRYFDVDWWFYLGRAYEAKGDSDGYIKAYKSVLKGILQNGGCESVWVLRTPERVIIIWPLRHTEQGVRYTLRVPACGVNRGMSILRCATTTLH